MAPRSAEVKAAAAAITTLLLAALLAAPAAATPLVPASDDQIVQRLPALRPIPAGQRSPERAVADARALFEQARTEGDPRGAGQALALLQPLLRSSEANPQVSLLVATIEQHLHDFDAAAARLEALLANPAAARQLPQAWLTLATIRRVQGRYDDSDRACRELQARRVQPHANACLAENQGLRGQFAPARAALALMRSQTRDADTLSWLAVTAGELEARAGDAIAAERALREALRLAPDAYAELTLADLLLDLGRKADALVVLAPAVPTDAVMLRRARAGDDAAARELRERFAQADLRPGGAGAHARERAGFALYVEHDARRALALARESLTVQRESADLLLMARAAQACGDAAALAEARRLADGIHLHDQRLASL